MFKGWCDEALQAYVEHGLKEVEGGVELKCRPSREADIFGSFPKRLWPSLSKVTTPTQVLYGQHSYPFVARSVARWCAGNAHVSAQVVAGGHCFMQEFPAASAARKALSWPRIWSWVLHITADGPVTPWRSRSGKSRFSLRR